MIRAHLATFPPRRRILRRVVEAMLPQVDHLFVVLNEYEDIPGYLARDPRITAVIPDRDVKDAGKFWFTPEPDDWVFLIDDDIGYPPDYVAATLARLEGVAHRGHAFGYHAAMLQRTPEGGIGWRMHVFADGLDTITGATLLGTGTVCARGAHIAPLSAMEGCAGYVDYGYNHWLQQQGTLPWGLPRAAGWLTNDLPKNLWASSLFKTVHKRRHPHVGLKLASFAHRWPHVNIPYDTYRATAH